MIQKDVIKKDFKPENPEHPYRLKLLACEIFYRELCMCAARAKNIIDLQFLSQGLHDLKTEKMLERLQKEIDAVDPERYSAILLGFALCNNGIAGLQAREIPIVIPRAHDCIALFFGSRDSYDEYFKEYPGTYFKTTGWIERDHENLEENSDEDLTVFGALKTFEQFVEKYGEENAIYLMETMGGLKHYSRMAYIDMPDLAPLPYDEETREQAEKTGLEFFRQTGDFSWLQNFADGPWDEKDYLILQPGQTIVPSHNEDVIRAE
ncbi:MAG: DUF1638 domain-containing protein [Candidatus Sumerlaeia bacterium]